MWPKWVKPWLYWICGLPFLPTILILASPNKMTTKICWIKGVKYKLSKDCWLNLKPILEPKFEPYIAINLQLLFGSIFFNLDFLIKKG